ncbi:hypothetical protein E4U10_007625 [Claviceps purpurea]|nr:hypothetical protein E4U10_007625 [Claviceps purpurea]KAG6212676.1 hypothetical protein E4U50_001824 [Claviceps purpurea]
MGGLYSQQPVFQGGKVAGWKASPAEEEFMSRFFDVMHADTEELFVERREQLHGYNPAMVPYLDANWWPYRGRFVNYSTNKIMAYGETRVEGSHGLLKRWLDHCSNNDIYKLAKKMLNWWEL